MARKKKTGLGRGLDSLIPVLPEDDDESEENSSLTLEDMLKEKDEGEDKDSKKSKEEDNSKKPNETSKKIANEVSKTQKAIENVEKTDIEESKAKSKEIATEEPSTSEPIEDEIETKSKLESSQIAETDQAVGETLGTSDTESMKTQVETPQPFDEKDDVVKVANVAEAEDTQNENEKTDDEIRNSLTEREKQSIDEVIKIIDKNPRITLWSAKSAAVFRYLRKTEPEFSISKEASKLIDEAVQDKYPEIWLFFKDIEK